VEDWDDEPSGKEMEWRRFSVVGDGGDGLWRGRLF
jgi:hypothetical protein